MAVHVQDRVERWKRDQGSSDSCHDHVDDSDSSTLLPIVLGDKKINGAVETDRRTDTDMDGVSIALPESGRNGLTHARLLHRLRDRQSHSGNLPTQLCAALLAP
jgi:TFIIF-interacting CTD phosphatase-like protein